MDWNPNDVTWLVLARWLQLAVGGGAICYALARTYAEWRAVQPRRVRLYAAKAIAPATMATFAKSA